ncbi:unnamed protein product, partial [marine sediment metagenome]
RSMVVAILFIGVDIMALGGWTGFAYCLTAGVVLGLAG